MPAPARLRIIYPVEFAADTGGDRRVRILGGFQRVSSSHQGNVVDIDSNDEPLPKYTEQLSITMSNPGISAPEANNYWKFETSSILYRVTYDVNFDVPGFKIYGDFRTAEAVGAILSPNVPNTVGIWFVLESDLPFLGFDSAIENNLRVHLPPGFRAIDSEDKDGNMRDCGFNDYSQPNNAKQVLPSDERQFLPMPSGTECRRVETPEGNYIELKVDGDIEYGLDYAFQFTVINAEHTPSNNVFRFETLVDGVILHLQENIQGFNLESLHTFAITPQDTTANMNLARITFDMMSDKAIPGGSEIYLYAPRGFAFTCAYFRTTGLAPTTQCYTGTRDGLPMAKFTVDTQGELGKGSGMQPMDPFQILVFVQNPPYTPQPNHWAAEIISPLKNFIDKIKDVEGFYITGPIDVRIMPTFAYKGERNGLAIEFIPTTILNQADDGNEIMITAPLGFEFERNCTDFRLRWTNLEQLHLDDDSLRTYPNVEQYNFPPPHHTCQGSGSNVLYVRLGRHAGLLTPYNYTIEVDVINPKFEINTTNIWTFKTQVRHPAERPGDPDTVKIVDANLNIMGFFLRDLERAPDDVSQAAIPLLLALFVW